MTREHSDLIVIGAGSAARDGARKAHTEHGARVALTDGGLGVAFFAPFSARRYFFPWRPIEVSPIGLGFFSERGLQVFEGELVWVWLPSLALVAAVWALRKLIKLRATS